MSTNLFDELAKKAKKDYKKDRQKNQTGKNSNMNKKRVSHTTQPDDNKGD